jgi:hypothetical protein
MSSRVRTQYHAGAPNARCKATLMISFAAMAARTRRMAAASTPRSIRRTSRYGGLADEAVRDCGPGNRRGSMMKGPLRFAVRVSSVLFLQDQWFCNVCDRILSASAEDGSFEVECILDKRVGPGGKTEYKVRWAGHSDEHDSWLPVENFSDHDHETSIVAAFERGGAVAEPTSTACTGPGKPDTVFAS